MKVDVLIVGAGPAGLMAGAWMARTGVKTLIIDQKPCRTQSGHADGIESRTLEILDSFGIGEGVWRDSNRTIELSLWYQQQGVLQREAVMQNCNPGLSRYQECTLGQGKIEQRLLDLIHAHDCVEVQWNTSPVDLRVNIPGEYRIEMQIQTVQEVEIKTIHAKYLLGCDGAHSWVRERLGLRLEGDKMDEHWGVFDAIPITDFPDIRKRCIVRSPVGHLMVIPREARLVRCYVQLDCRTAAEFKKNYHADILVKLVATILQPYRFEASQLEWSTIYTVGQRLCQTLSMHNRVFLAGDAIHTHSPKAGQGMNVSMQDTFNLGWKLAAVLKGQASARILRTYEVERLAVAVRLVEFDKRMVQAVCGRTLNAHTRNSILQEENSSASGLTARYCPSLLTVPRGDLAANLTVGMRFPSTPVFCQSDARPWHLQQLLQSTGAWHLLVFGGNLSAVSQMKRVERLAAAVADHHLGILSAYLIHCASRQEVDLMDLPALFRPFDASHGYDYWKVFADRQPSVSSHGPGEAYRFYGVGEEGCVVLLRPDQHVSFIGSLEDINSIVVIFTSIGWNDRDS
ncbi:hypothetical protein ASPZODRAFT_2122335 [Penicilliopsis zonata CBS 506.65]|uniref:FAD-binding domain-containing protein n=1 Tax=Penicilliopsis zonata CBS 506.65 TaxID=1073090 RepID=A0A1L9S594_9EURO|nr:hypothetical protein ASPZODRAFT_2122335 [Penicilliopsis zonata CBS 506.65]OJJ42343.1 hypothetical protein ASPZODRAFT_2122335 [Penicilliopsis zonata CBS 506.65]